MRNFVNSGKITFMDSVLKRLPKYAFELTITIPWSDVLTYQEKITSEIIKNMEVDGFRKGKAPKKLAEDKVDKDKLFQEVVKQLVPDMYLEALKKHELNPVVHPKIDLVSFKEGEAWVFKATACEKPEVDLGSYQDEVKKITAKSKIVLPGKEPETPKLEELIQALLEGVKLEIPDLIVENETNRLLAKLLDEIKALGLTLEQYLSSIGKSSEQLRNEYTQKAINDLKLEFILDKIAEVEKITVTPEEIEEVIQKTEDKNSQNSLRQNSYLLASIVRQKKTLDFVKNL